MSRAATILDELEAATWATHREDKIRVIENALGIRHAPHYPTMRDRSYDPERLAIAARAAGLLP